MTLSQHVATKTKKAPRSALDNKMSGTLDVLQSASNIDAIADAIKVLSDKVLDVSSQRARKEIHKEFMKVAAATHSVSSKIKKDALKSAPIGNLSYVHQRKVNYEKRQQLIRNNRLHSGTSVVSKQPGVLRSIENIIDVGVFHVQKERRTSARDKSTAPTWSNLPTCAPVVSPNFPPPAGKQYTPSEVVSILSAAKQGKNRASIGRYMISMELIPVKNICNVYRLLKKAEKGVPPPEWWNQRGNPPLLTYTEMGELVCDPTNRRSIGKGEVNEAIVEKKRKQLRKSGMHVPEGLTVSHSTKTTKRYKTGAAEAAGGGAATSTIQKTNRRHE